MGAGDTNGDTTVTRDSTRRAARRVKLLRLVARKPAERELVPIVEWLSFAAHGELDHASQDKAQVVAQDQRVPLDSAGGAVERREVLLVYFTAVSQRASYVVGAAEELGDVAGRPVTVFDEKCCPREGLSRFSVFSPARNSASAAIIASRT